MTKRALLPIVEGQSEVESVPLLLRRVDATIRVVRPFRIKRHRVVRPNELERSISLGILDRDGVGAILVLIDADDDNPRVLEERLLQRARACTRFPVAAIAANRELEAWFLGAKESLRGLRNIRADAVSPVNPEGIRDAKRKLSDNMTPPNHYLPTDDQPAFADRFDYRVASAKCPSLARFLVAVAGLSTALK